MEFKHIGHYLLWDWLSKNPCKEKFEWPGWKSNGGEYEDIENYCFACCANNLSDCHPSCPLIWPEFSRGKDSCGDLCFDWSYSGRYGDNDIDKRTKLAQQIRDLPVREGVKCI
jgi:hypothetical protein